MKNTAPAIGLHRRDFLRAGAGAVLGSALAPLARSGEPVGPRSARVSIVTCRGYDPREVRAAFDRSFDQLGGIGALVPERQADLARLGVKVLVISTLANFLSAAIAGMLL